ncbi:hypothetical protein [Sansalvadorimonas verongulae]|uniref:hypothetical protein n=1 Tax=Sansalvadorimonas verongulae TaxID=2172824 RepID=UPI0012BC96AD|nr:hypothetical protein [Sansalvadorimonas verongulae]MTI11781.1 hypothetical protein [Sansalvadorimonas verongulae]
MKELDKLKAFQEAFFIPENRDDPGANIAFLLKEVIKRRHLMASDFIEVRKDILDGRPESEIPIGPMGRVYFLTCLLAVLSCHVETQGEESFEDMLTDLLNPANHAITFLKVTETIEKGLLQAMDQSGHEDIDQFLREVNFRIETLEKTYTPSVPSSTH